MDLGLKGKVALVAAASQGLGKAVATGFASEGCRVAICARNQEALDATAREIEEGTEAEMLAVRADVSQAKDIENLVARTIERFGGIDILVSNAGGPPTGPFVELGEEEWQQAISLTLLSAARLARAVISTMRTRGGGSIIFMTSFAAKEPTDNVLLSNSLRAAVHGLSKTLANELGPLGIRVNAVMPGWILTDRMHEVVRSQAERAGQSLEQALQARATSNPLRRLGQPEEFANLVVFLASERASYITGASVPVDGGYLRALM